MKTPRPCLRHCAFFILHSALALCALTAQRTDNRHLFWSGGDGASWDGAAASWATSGSYLGTLTGSTAIWVTGTDAPPALPATAFIAGDSVVFDSLADNANDANRNITIAAGGVTVSDMVVSGTGNYTFTGGAITADGSSVAAGSVHLSGSGVTPGGRLVKIGAGVLTLSNTVANHFAGGIHIGQGVVEIADIRALGNNNISLLTTTTTGATGANADAHGQARSASNAFPAAVLDATGNLLRAGTQPFSTTPGTLRVAASAAGLDITGEIFLGTGTLGLDIEGDTTISGRIMGPLATTGISSAGAFIKTGDGMLTITGSINWFLGPNAVTSGTLVITNVGALGNGNIDINPGATFVMRDIRNGDNFPQAITGNGRVEITDCDMTLNYRHGYVIGALATADHVIDRLVVTRSRLFALASGTQASALGGPGSTVTIAGHSTLVLGREGVVGGVSGLLAPINYPIFVKALDVDATSALVFHPGTNLIVTGTLDLAPGSALTFAGSGFSRLEYTTLGTASASPDDLLVRPAGYSLETTRLAGEGGRQRRDYLVINQGANPMHDIAMTTGAIDTIVAAVADRLNEHFLMPTTEPSRGRQKREWANVAWARYITSAVDHKSGSEFRPGHSGRLNGLVFGLDSAYRLRVNFGIYGGLTESDLKTTNDTSLLSKQRYFGVSATPRFKRYYLTADLFTGNANSESLRRETSASTIAHWKNNFMGFGIEAGAVFRPWENGFLRPRAGLRHTIIDVGGYHERALIEASPMRIDNFTDTLTQINLALEAAHRCKLFGREAMLGATLGGKRHVQEPGATIDAAFSDYPGQGFTLGRGDYYEDALSLGVSLGMVVTQRTRAGLALEYERGSNHERLTASLVVNCIW